MQVKVKRIFWGIILIFLVIILFLWWQRNCIITHVLKKYAQQKWKGNLEIENLDCKPFFIKVDRVKFYNDNLEIYLEGLSLYLLRNNLKLEGRCKKTEVVLKRKINSLRLPETRILRNRYLPMINLYPLKFDVDKFILKDISDKLKIECNLSFIKDRKGFRSMQVNVFNCEAVNLIVKNSQAEYKDTQGRIRLKLIKFKNFSLKDVNIDFKLLASKVYLTLHTPSIGKDFVARGYIDLMHLPQIFVNVRCERISFLKVVQCLNLEDKIYITGVFKGKLRMHLEKMKILDLKIEFENAKGGRIKWTQDVDFLKKRIAGGYYKVLKNSLSNYCYEYGYIKAEDETKDIAIDFIFGSEVQGERHLKVILHNFLRR